MRCLANAVWCGVCSLLIGGALLGVNGAAWAQTPESLEPWSWRPQRTARPAGRPTPAVVPHTRTVYAEEQYDAALESPPARSARSERPASVLIARPDQATANRAAAVGQFDQVSLPPAQRGRLMARSRYQPPPATAMPEELPPGPGMEAQPEAYDMHPRLEPFAPQHGPGCASGDCGHGGCDSCGHGGCDTYGHGCGKSVCADWLQNLTVGAGLHGFKAPLDFGFNGNFGAHVEVNWGAPLWNAMGLGFQAGYGFHRSNFSGQNQFVPGDDRQQHFVTLGLFKRADCCGGLQYGLVWDTQEDNYFNNAHLSQIRGEVSFVGSGGKEIGFLGMFAMDDDQIGGTTLGDVQPLDQYLLFFRKQFCAGPVGRLYGGVSGEGNGIFGGDLLAPLDAKWAFQANFVYVAADGARGGDSRDDEFWSLGMKLVYSFGCGTTNCCNQYRPLFDVANNGTFLVDRPNQGSLNF